MYFICTKFKKKMAFTNLKRSIPFYLISLNLLTNTKFEQMITKYIDKTSISIQL